MQHQQRPSIRINPVTEAIDHQTNIMLSNGNAFDDSESDSIEAVATLAPRKSTKTATRKIATKRIEGEKKIIDVALKKERRAIRLFQYIEKCERIEKQQKLAKLTAHVAKQRKILEEQTIKLNSKMKDMKMEAQKKKANAISEKRQLLLQIGRANGDQAGTPVDVEDLYAFKSKFYDQQANELKSIRSKVKDQQNQFRTKRAELFQKFSAKKDVEEGKVVMEPIHHQNEPDMQNELERIIKKYTRPDSPIAGLGRNRTKMTSMELLLKAKSEATRRMTDNLFKNKTRTKQLTNGARNHFGMTSSISVNFQESTRHARTIDDPIWDMNKPEVYIDPSLEREPIEYILKSKKGPPTSFVSPAKPSIGSKKTQAFVGFDIVEVKDDAPEEDPTQEVERKLKSNKSLTSEEQKLIDHTTSVINARTRFVQFRPKTVANLIAKSPQPNANINPTIFVPEPEGNHDFDDIIEEETTSDNDGEYLMPETARNRRKSRKSVVDKNHPMPGRQSMASNSRRPSMALPIPNSSNHQRRASNIQDLHLRRPSNIQDPHQRRSSNIQDLHIRRPSNNIAHSADLPFGSPISDERDPVTTKQQRSSEAYPENPFSGNYLVPTDEVNEAPLIEWLQEVHSTPPGKKVVRAERWPAISLDAVAEFGKTVYTKKSLSLANAAENEVKIAKSKQPRTQYPKKTMRLDEYFTERFEKSANVKLSPVKGARLKFWEPELKYRELVFIDDEEAAEV